MKYSRFEDLPVWQDSIKLAERIFLLTVDKSFHAQGDLRNQLQRAGVSVSNNIAEGFERGTTQELLTFLYTARGSAGEVRPMLMLLDRLPWFQHLAGCVAELRTLAESISRQLRGWADSLQNSSISGPRYLTDKSRKRDQQTRQANAFWSKLELEHRKRLDRGDDQRLQSDPES